jgi:hypothetical protein
MVPCGSERVDTDRRRNPIRLALKESLHEQARDFQAFADSARKIAVPAAVSDEGLRHEVEAVVGS